MTTQLTDAPPTTQTDRLAVPPLQSGDRLTRREFERRYAAMPRAKKAELIEGVVYMASPLHADHGRPHGAIMTWLGTYQATTPGTDVLDNTSLRNDMATVLRTLQLGLATPEYADFSKRLNQQLA